MQQALFHSTHACLSGLHGRCSDLLVPGNYLALPMLDQSTTPMQVLVKCTLFLLYFGLCIWRAAAAVEVITRELKMRTNNINAPRPADSGLGRGAKRKRTQAPEETCPYCTHVYTVRDGLSNKPDIEGNRQATPPALAE